jgi:5-methylcytosine-specific restriction endonuclease McrA
MGSAIGVAKVTAARLGISLEDYQGRLVAGEKWCMRCDRWRPLGDFGADRSRGDGRASTCHECRRVKVRKTTKGRVSTFKGHKHTPEAIEAMRQARLGKPGPKKGIQRTEEVRQKISRTLREGGNAVTGEQHHAFKDGKLAERRGIRFTAEYKRWRYDVFTRDGFKCQHCGDSRGRNLQAHHIKPFADFPDLRFETTNGLTLCRKCHKAEHQK